MIMAKRNKKARESSSDRFHGGIVRPLALNIEKLKRKPHRTLVLADSRRSKLFTALRLILFTLVTASLSRETIGEGNVGCKFVQTLCLDDTEVCYDDNIFGKCISTAGANVEEIQRTPLTPEQSHLLATMLQEMQGNGLGWDHPYVQCRIQGTLFSLERQTPLPPNLCSNLSPLPSANERAASMDFLHAWMPYDEAKYMMEQNPDDRFYPPLKRQYYRANDMSYMPRHHRIPNDYIMDPSRDSDGNWESGPINVYLQNALDRIFRDELKLKLGDHSKLNPIDLDGSYFLRNGPNPELRSSYNHSIPQRPFLHEKRMDKEKVEGPRQSIFRELSHLQQEKENFNESGNAENEALKAVSDESLDDKKVIKGQEDLLRNSLRPFEEEALLLANSHSSGQRGIQEKQSETMMDEAGSLVLAKKTVNNRHSEEERKNLVREFFANILGFRRHERLDVKKPGPLVGPPPLDDEENSVKVNLTKEGTSVTLRPSDYRHQKQKKVITLHSDRDHSWHTVDTEYAHVLVQNSIDSWSDGVRIVNELANILRLQGFFTYLTVQPHEVSFRVDSTNPKHKTASDVARDINQNVDIKNGIYRRLGVIILKAGVGDKIKRVDDNDVSVSYLQSANDDSNITYILMYMFAGAGAAAILVLCVTLTLIKRHDRKRSKCSAALEGTSHSGADTSSKDYQELCRARMATKGSSTEALSGNRILSLSRENERLPPSRSSTTSWSEEPALTNMDISTGHMLLSYMEDHLRNKDRLKQEWDALCRYQAEPSACEAALQSQCVQLNRPGAPLPYDHSRVVLNHLANADGLDYINASTITDHDPRAPAYVAAQGPLPTTLNHFWQMIWEQGAVVIVALCRLDENGDKACARYWPLEGAEIYHIYEVHLVSEHIWCDDYLVRSFYLKNLRTSETRTVTQFHFLSWPQGGVPLQAKALLDFRRKVNKSYRGRSCPIVVHGSNGAGRTGVYILLDLVLGRMSKGAREIDIAATLEHLRDQRADLVSTQQQFEFVLMAVAEEVHAILRALPSTTGTATIEKIGEQSILKEELPKDN